jgi:shikimate dehydrogenase
MIPSAKAMLAGIIGWPVEHSLSPRLHGFWLERHKIDGAYVALAVRPEDLFEVLRLLPRIGFRGANITVPHKEAALAAMDEVEPLARSIGAVNTVVVRADGSLEGRNTDAYGFLENLRQGAAHWHAPHKPAAVIGAGGAARAICVALLDVGVPEIYLVNRTPERAERLAEELGDQVIAIRWENHAAALGEAALVVNATTLGMKGEPETLLDLKLLPKTAVVTDIVYTPLETPLLAAARKRGNPVVDGLGMLIHQARPGFEAWFGVRPEATDELRAFLLKGSGTP